SSILLGISGSMGFNRLFSGAPTSASRWLVASGTIRTSSTLLLGARPQRTTSRGRSRGMGTSQLSSLPTCSTPATCTTTRACKRHKDATSVRFIAANIYDNKILMAADPNYEKNLKSLPLVEMRRLLLGDWTIRRAGGKLFRKDWFKVVDAIPASIVRQARGWD